MILEVKNRQSTIAPKLSYDVLIENQADGTVKATLLNLPECQGFGADKQAAIDNLIDVLAVKNTEIATLEINYSVTTYPFKEISEKDHHDGNVWDLLDSLTGTIEAPSNWSLQHDYYLYGTPKNDDEIRE